MCYVMQMGVGGCQNSQKKLLRYLALRGGVQFPGKKRYLALEWPLIYSFSKYSVLRCVIVYSKGVPLNNILTFAFT